MSDERNWLFRQYKEILRRLDPDGFVFENVTGLLNMQGGKIFEMVRSELQTEARTLDVWKLQAEQYGIPQRRTRVVIAGVRRGERPSAPEVLTEMPSEANLFRQLPRAISAEEALSDLPPLRSGEDGSTLDYLWAPKSAYQEFMRGLLTPTAYIERLTRESLVVLSA
jgi:DNA (cytosine-5)-methyltransferase 1